MANKEAHQALVVLGLLAVIPGIVFYQGFVLSCLWAWFVLPIGGMHLSLVNSCGLVVLVHTLMVSKNDSNYEFGLIIVKELSSRTDADPTAGKLRVLLHELEKQFDDKKFWGSVIGVCRPAFSLVTGWVIHLFM